MIAGTAFQGVFSASLFKTRLGILFLVIVPVSLLALPAWLLYGVISQSLQREGSSAARLRLFLVQLALIFAISLPQALIIGSFVSSALGSWFTSDVSLALSRARSVADLYEEERLRDMNAVSDRFFNGLAIVNYRSWPRDWMSDIRSIDVLAAACQIYRVVDRNGTAAYEPVMESGDSSRFLSRTNLVFVRNGQLFFDENEVYRWGQLVRYSNETYVCVYTSRAAPGFFEARDHIASVHEQTGIIDILDPFLPWFGLWAYILFCLPTVCMVLTLSWRFSCSFTAPLRALQGVLESFEEGESGIRLVPHSQDEISQSAQAVNRLASKR